MKILRRMEWPEPGNLNSIEELSEFCMLLYQTLTEESALRAGELDVAFTDGYNVILGHEAGVSMAISLDDDEGVYNVFIGHQAGYSNTTGYENIGIGTEALYSNTTGYANVAIGYNAIKANTIGVQNVAIGTFAMQVAYQGLGNIGVGTNALNALTEGQYNVAIGSSAGSRITTGSDNVFIGKLAGYPETGASSNKLYIANSNTATPLIYGNFSNRRVKIYDYLYLPNMKTGNNQGAAGAATGELWADTNDNNTIKLGT